ncbi:MAG TPA: UDP-N-acetylmuramoyl-L-alanyl-D-glutamate--2,6-diaminopimelate ligase [Saprospiraceae bacterium]|nr:UDP-N-acetylmuramoyl-L-alanyl-D-glutamate--2,6-diaminopimelate ligase [Saprospiraceae bacterium]HMQ81790.1 UDP-N-acetylmuramoyl-L-alanyl-D-glutamate--2,6-diaminopimelate ligase [Saprospiraceae bacterium]
MNLVQLLQKIEVIQFQGESALDIKQIEFDSRKVGPGALFVAVKGTQTDGHQYIDKAIERGAVAILVENWPNEISQEMTYIQVSNSAKALGQLADAFYGQPSRELKLVGITGTNGKTSCATLLYELFTQLGYKVGLLSTVENKIAHQRIAATHTTPDPVNLQALLREMVMAGCDYAFMEVSSHAIDQERIAGLHFTGGVFTNISHDHLDYHKTFKAYIEAKKKFFDNLPKTAFALSNSDDKRGEVMLQNCPARKYTFSLRSLADFKAKMIENSLTGLHLKLDDQEIFSRLIGEFNAYNLLAVYGVAVLLEQDKWEILTALSSLSAPEGRFEYVIDAQKGRYGIVDYAHTPDALEKVLQTIWNLRHPDSKIITVVGCGGDRDKLKRPIMAKISCDNSHWVILTSDNPRTESAEAILEDMNQGIPPDAIHKVMRISDRREAIKVATNLAGAGDIVLVAGKGHEKYQEIKGIRYPFDDKAELKVAFG